VPDEKREYVSSSPSFSLPEMGKNVELFTHSLFIQNKLEPSAIF
jgi:hypothetical protein